MATDKNTSGYTSKKGDNKDMSKNEANFGSPSFDSSSTDMKKDFGSDMMSDRNQGQDYGRSNSNMNASKSNSISSNMQSGMQQNDQANQSPADAIPAALAQVVDQAIHSLQPKIHDAVNDIAEKAVDLSHQAARDVAYRVRRNPWYTVGGIALLIVGLGLVFGLEERRERRFAGADLH